MERFCGGVDITGDVHKSGDETIAGIKKFTSTLNVENSGTYLRIKNPNLTRGTFPAQQYNFLLSLEDGDITVGNRFGLVETLVRTNGEIIQRIGAVKNVSENPSNASIDVCYPIAGEPYATAPSTPIINSTTVSGRMYNQSGATDILTRNWIPKDTRIVHTTDDESISGIKTFNNIASSPAIIIKSDTLQENTAVEYTKAYNMIRFTGNDDKKVGVIDIVRYNSSNMAQYLQMLVYRPDDASLYTGIRIGVNNQNTQTFEPSTNNCKLGSASYKWTQLYAQTSSIETSDKRMKQQINPIPDEILDAWGEVNWVQFKFNDAVNEKDNARLHTGLIAQDIDSTFKKYGLDISKYGLFCYDEFEAEYNDEKIIDREATYEEITVYENQELDENGNAIGQANSHIEKREISPEESHIEHKLIREAGNQYSLRYIECLAMECAYLRRKMSILEEKISNLENGK